MIQENHVPARYSHEVFQKLEPLNYVFEKLKKLGLQKEQLGDIGKVFRDHGVANKFGLMMLHRHFSMEPNELLVEYGNVATPWPVLPPTVNSFDALEEYPPTVFGGKLVPRCWKVHNGSLIPTEFGYNPQGADYGSDQKLGPKGRYSEVEFDSGFVTAIVNTLVERNLQDIFGITVVDNVELDGIMGIERTIGRVSITLPVTIPLNSNHPQDIEEDGSQTQDDILDEVLQTGVESVWTFGCHQKMENSRILPARICWVCESCK